MSEEPRRKMAKWWMVDVHTGHCLCWVPGPTAAAALAVYRIQEPDLAGSVRAVQVDESGNFEPCEPRDVTVDRLMCHVEEVGLMGDEDAGWEADAVAITLNIDDSPMDGTVILTIAEAARITQALAGCVARAIERRED